jgi:anaerobic selenocysteine-containing dehydrogenase
MGALLNMMKGVERRKSYCRFCHVYCALEVEISGGRVVKVYPDPSDPVYGGYTCLKGRELAAVHNHKDRLRSSLKRLPDGRYEEISSEQAMDEIAEKLTAIIARDGPRSIATYNGSYAFQNSAAVPVCRAWHNGIKSPSYYTSVTIDQPAKAISGLRAGFWGAGVHRFAEADVIMLIGNNPLVSHFSSNGGLPPFSPSRRLRKAMKAGLKVITVDPRKTETASRSNIHLAVKPGEDPVLLAGIIRFILKEDLQDHEFCRDHLANLDALSAQIEPFDLDYVSARVDVPVGDIEAAARMFATAGRGTALTGTGPDMSPHPNLTEHLVLALNAICGRFNRAGDPLNPSVLGSNRPRLAQAFAPRPPPDDLAKCRFQGLTEIAGLSAVGRIREMPVSVLSDEILTPGKGQVKALISVGGNPAVAWPDQEKTCRALEALELSVSIDIKMSATAKLADYIIAPRLCLEREDVTLLVDSWYEEPYSHYAEALVEPDFDVIEEWEFFWGLAKRMGTEIRLPGGPLNMENKPSKFEVLENVTTKSKVPLADIRAQDGGHVFDAISVVAAPPVSGVERLEMMPTGIDDELADVLSGLPAGSGEFGFLLISQRLKHVYNSSGRDIDALMKKGTTNPAYMHPDDLGRLGILPGDEIVLKSEHGQIPAIVEVSAKIKPGVISMSHAWGDVPGIKTRQSVREVGACIAQLVSSSEGLENFSGMPRFSSIPVNVIAEGGRV